MKRISMLLALGVSALIGTLMAQTPREINVRFDHAVMVNQTVLPAGDYTIQITNAGGGDIPVLIIQSRQHSMLALASRVTEAPRETASPRLVMQVKDGVHHLEKVVAGGTTFELQ